MPQLKSDTGKRVFLIHLFVYLIINAIFALINFAQTPEEDQTRELWFFWPLAGWGIGVTAHWLAMLFERKAKEGGPFADKGVQGLSVHLFVYVAVNALLFVIDLSGGPETVWFYWPLFGWGIAIAVHAFLTYAAVTRRTEGRFATKANPPAPKRKTSRKKSAASKNRRPGG